MKPGYAAAIAAVAAVIVLAAAVLLVHDEGWSISYETDGGVFDGDVPDSYREGDDFRLPVPEREGYVFMGWYLDAGFQERVETVEGLSGDLVLHARWIPAVEHSIHYEVDGGELPDGSPETFTGGVGVVLPVPERDGMVFGGWFVDPEFTTPVVVIGTDVFDDVTVYACWVEYPPTGTGYVWDVSGVYYNGDIRHTMDGTVKEEIVAEKDGSYYIETIRDITYSWPTGTTTDSGVSGRWSDQGAEELTYVCVEEVNGYMCTVWESEDGTRYWLYRMTLQVRAAVQDGTTDIVHDLREVYSFEPETTFVPDVTAEYPLKVIGASETGIGDRLVLTASGEGFTGWYSGDRLLTEERTLVVGRADPTGVFEARAADGYHVVDQTSVSLEDFGFGDGCVITDWDGNPVSEPFGSLSPGYYMVSDSNGPVKRYVELFVDETRTFGLTWEHGGRAYTISIGISYSDVFGYTYSDPYGNIRISLTDPDYVANYHTVGDGTLREVMEVLSAYGQGMDRTEFARLILSFVQNIPYVTDEESTGHREYWKYPLETLWDGGGDCEDSAILCDTLLLMAGYDVAFILFQDHAMSAVSVDVDGHHVEQDGIEYVMCETTNVWEMGQTSSGHTESDIYYWCPVRLTHNYP